MLCAEDQVAIMVIEKLGKFQYNVSLKHSGYYVLDRDIAHTKPPVIHKKTMGLHRWKQGGHQ